MELLVNLGLAVRTESGVEVIGKKKKPLTETEISRYETMYENFIDLWTLRFEKKIIDADMMPIRIAYNDEAENSIAEWFRIASRAEPDNTFLFCDTLSNKDYKETFLLNGVSSL
jgi:hypothetical protein